MLGLAAAASGHRSFENDPIPISVGPEGEAANGPSGGATISGDNRTGTYTAFHSRATNLVSRDTNGAYDVFLYRRPSGDPNHMDRQPARPAGTLTRSSVSTSGKQANGRSSYPSLDGANDASPRCVAFQSEATNLSTSDDDTKSDIYVRDFGADRTYLASRGIGASATRPSINGHCTEVAFQAGGNVFLAPVRSGSIEDLGEGRNPDHSLDGRGVTWERGGSVYLRRDGDVVRVTGDGRNPVVSNASSSPAVWAVVFDTEARLRPDLDKNTTSDVYMRAYRPSGGTIVTDLISAPRRGQPSMGGNNRNGGLTAFTHPGGIIVWVHHKGNRTDLWHRNNHSGGAGDLAHANSGNGRPAIFDAYTSARANFVAFSSNHVGEFVQDEGLGFPFDGNGPMQDVFLKHLTAGDRL